MIDKEIVKSLLQDELSRNNLFLVETIVRPGNKIAVFLDSMKGVTIEECMLISRFLESKLDRNIEDFELEVSSPGLDRPLKLPVQFEKNIGRFLDIVKFDGNKITGKLLGFNEGKVKLEVESIKKDNKGKKTKITGEEEINFDIIKTAKIVISLKSNR